MKDLNAFTITALKAKLRVLNLSTSGNKTELISRLNQADPSGQWMTDLGENTDEAEGEAGGAMVAQDIGTDRRGSRPPPEMLSERESEYERRERELMRRELELMRRENEQLRTMTQLTSSESASEVASKISLSNLKEMLPPFDGKRGFFQCWKEQMTVVRQMYQLNDNMTKLLLGAKLTGTAAEWFHSVPAHLSMTVDELLTRMEAMFDRRESKLTLRKEFENRVWRHGETFVEYFHQKIILANKIPIEEDEIVDYVIDGIPVRSIRSQAEMQRFPDKETMLRAMENVSLGSDKGQHKMEKISVTKDVKVHAESAKKIENKSGVKSELKCFNCNVVGHVAAKCQMPKRERGACFRCLQLGHKARDCPSREPTKKEADEGGAEKKTDVNSVFDTESESFYRTIDFQISSETEDLSVNCKLDTLLDTGSVVSFIKDSFVLPSLITPISSESSQYSGLNGSELEIKGRVKVRMALNNKERKCVSVLVVPPHSMKPSIVIGRDVLWQFFDKEKTGDKEAENQVIREILSISVDNLEPGESLKINPDVRREAQMAVKELYVEEYVKPTRPERPQTDTEIKLKLKDDKPFHFSFNRPSYAEKNTLRVLLDSLLEKGIIRPSESEYASPIVLVRKKAEI